MTIITICRHYLNRYEGRYVRWNIRYDWEVKLRRWDGPQTSVNNPQRVRLPFVCWKFFRQSSYSPEILFPQMKFEVGVKEFCSWCIGWSVLKSLWRELLSQLLMDSREICYAWSVSNTYVYESLPVACSQTTELCALSTNNQVLQWYRGPIPPHTHTRVCARSCIS